MSRLVVVIAVAFGMSCASGGSGDEPDARPGGNADAALGPDAPTCDGLPCEAIYVAATGSESAPGTRDAPVNTIAAGIAKAGPGGKAVFVAAGVYAESIVMSPGVGVYGGFGAGWQRSGEITEIVGGSPAVAFDGISDGSVLDRVTVRAADASAPGASSVAVAIVNSQRIELRDVIVMPGLGANGSDGADGAGGAAGGANGTIGQRGCEDSGGLCSSCGRPQGGAGGFSFCGTHGGRGGNSGRATAGGDAGSDGIAGTPKGGGAPGESQDGGEGAPGAPGGPGGNGAGGGTVGTFAAYSYQPANGGDGTPGGNGQGGGGGGGGGGGTTDCDSYGSSGGGGGGGGCGGGNGTAGGGGGGSFGVIAVDSAVVIRSSMVVAAAGGAGGRGGNGGIGTAGGTGGGGGPYGGSGEQDDGGDGARGGNGGLGGNGGHAGGGGGGPSAAVVCVGSATITIPQSMLVAGIAGAGGASAVNPGAMGTATNAIGCSFF